MSTPDLTGAEIMIDIEINPASKKAKKKAERLKAMIKQDLDKNILVIIRNGRKNSFEVTVLIRANTHDNHNLKVPDGILSSSSKSIETSKVSAADIKLENIHSSEQTLSMVDVDTNQPTEINDPVSSLPNIVLHSKLNGEGYPAPRFVECMRILNADY